MKKPKAARPSPAGIDDREPERTPASRRPPRAAFALLLLLVALLGFYRAMVFSGHEPVSGDSAAAGTYHQWAEETRAQTGEVPLWYPNIYLGMPSYGSFIHTPANPMFDLHRALGLNRGMRYVLWFLIGGVGIFAWLRRWGATHAAAFLGALSFVFTPYMLGAVNAGHSSKLMVLTFAPLVFLSVDALLRHGRWFHVGAVAAATAFQLWGNHPQLAFYTWLVVGPFALVWLWREGRGVRLRRSAALISALALAVMMVTLPYLPILHYTPESTRGAASVIPGESAGGTHSWAYATSWSFHPAESPSFVFPSFFGLEGSTYWGWMPFTQSTHSIGAIVLLFALAGFLVMRGWRRNLWIALAACVVVLGFGKYLPVLYRPFYEFVPLFDRFRVPSMIYTMLPLLLVVPMALAFDRVARGAGRTTGGDDDPAPRLATFFRGAAILFGVAALVGIAGREALGPALERAGWFQREWERVTGSISAELLGARRGLFFGDLTRVGLVAGAASAIAFLRLRNRIPPLAFWLAAGVLLTADLYVVDRSFYSPVLGGRSVGFDVDGAVEAEITKDGTPVRVLPLQLAPRGEQLSVNLINGNQYASGGMQSVAGYHPAGLRRVKDLALSRVWLDPRVWRALDVAYVAIHVPVSGLSEAFRANIAAQFPELERVLSATTPSGDVMLLRHPHSLGRAYVVPGARVITGGAERLAYMGSGAFDPAREVILEAPAPGALDADSTWSARARVTSYVAERVDIEVEGDGGFLVLADAYYPDWTVTLDGEQVPVLAANHVLRAVAVPPGSHHVSFVFSDRSHELASAMSTAGRAATAILLLVGLVLEWRRRSRPGAAPA